MQDDAPRAPAQGPAGEEATREHAHPELIGHGKRHVPVVEKGTDQEARGDLLTIALYAFFVAMIAIVVAMLAVAALT